MLNIFKKAIKGRIYLAQKIGVDEIGNVDLKVGAVVLLRDERLTRLEARAELLEQLVNVLLHGVHEAAQELIGVLHLVANELLVHLFQLSFYQIDFSCHFFSISAFSRLELEICKVPFKTLNTTPHTRVISRNGMTSLTCC